MRPTLALLFAALIIPSFAHAQSFDGRYEGKAILTQGGDDCGAKSDEFLLEVKGANIRIASPRADKPIDGKIESNGQLAASGPGRGNVTLEFRAQILATKTGLGTLLQKGSGICQFLISLKRS